MVVHSIFPIHILYQTVHVWHFYRWQQYSEDCIQEVVYLCFCRNYEWQCIKWNSWHDWYRNNILSISLPVSCWPIQCFILGSQTANTILLLLLHKKELPFWQLYHTSYDLCKNEPKQSSYPSFPTKESRTMHIYQINHVNFSTGFIV